jgi:broad specificity phosphatase PhoE
MGFGGDVLVVRHGVINALLLCVALDVPISRVWDFLNPAVPSGFFDCDGGQ